MTQERESQDTQENVESGASEPATIAVVAAAGQTPSPFVAAPVTPGVDPRRRLRELLSVPERDRSDEQWDEINELEIQLAPGNRVHPGSNPGGPVGFPSGGGGRHFQQKKHPPKGDKGIGGGKRRPRPANKAQQG